MVNGRELKRPNKEISIKIANYSPSSQLELSKSLLPSEMQTSQVRESTINLLREKGSITSNKTLFMNSSQIFNQSKENPTKLGTHSSLGVASMIKCNYSTLKLNQLQSRFD